MSREWGLMRLRRETLAEDRVSLPLMRSTREPNFFRLVFSTSSSSGHPTDWQLLLLGKAKFSASVHGYNAALRQNGIRPTAAYHSPSLPSASCLLYVCYQWKLWGKEIHFASAIQSRCYGASTVCEKASLQQSSFVRLTPIASVITGGFPPHRQMIRIVPNITTTPLPRRPTLSLDRVSGGFAPPTHNSLISWRRSHNDCNLPHNFRFSPKIEILLSPHSLALLLSTTTFDIHTAQHETCAYQSFRFKPNPNKWCIYGLPSSTQILIIFGHFLVPSDPSETRWNLFPCWIMRLFPSDKPYIYAH